MRILLFQQVTGIYNKSNMTTSHWRKLSKEHYAVKSSRFKQVIKCQLTHIILSFVFLLSKSPVLNFAVSVWWNFLVHCNNFLLAHYGTITDSKLQGPYCTYAQTIQNGIILLFLIYVHKLCWPYDQSSTLSIVACIVSNTSLTSTKKTKRLRSSLSTSAPSPWRKF